MRPVWPARVSQPFAAAGSYASRDDEHGRAGHHTGVDFGAAWPLPLEGRVVRSVLPGIVVISDYNSTMGIWVGVYNREHDLLVTYWHLSERYPRVGVFVRAGDPLGRVGSTGNSSAPHLHVQVNRGSTFNYHGHINPGVAFKLAPRSSVMKRLRKRVARRRVG